ncbi:hypothetical protein N9772_07245 [Bacteroidia bacterium]|nr:hypothetical protein [Bacteroidia bacterium]
MIDILKTEIEELIGRKINNRGDCEYLSNAIFDSMSIDISFNTLRRIYGLLPATKPNISTLNILAEFLGYNNFFHFSQTYHYKERIQLSEVIYQAIKENNDEQIINIVNNSKNIPNNFLSLIIILVRELLHNEKYLLIVRIFNLKSLDLNSFSYFEVLRIGNSIGLLLQAKTKVDTMIFNNEKFLDFVYMTFVDYSNLNNYYGDVSEIISSNKHRADITIFSKSILEFRNFLNNKSFNHIDLDIIYKKKLHPILSGRLLALKLLATTSYETIDVIKTYHTSIKEKSNLLDHYFELFTTSILLKNIDLMRFLIHNISIQIRFYHQRIHVNSFNLMCLFYYKLSGDLENQNCTTDSFNLSDCLSSYRDFMNILWHTYQFSATTDNSEKKKIKSTYLELSEELAYPFFSESFLQNYFIESHLD